MPQSMCSGRTDSSSYKRKFDNHAITSRKPSWLNAAEENQILRTILAYQRQQLQNGRTLQREVHRLTTLAAEQHILLKQLHQRVSIQVGHPTHRGTEHSSQALHDDLSLSMSSSPRIVVSGCLTISLAVPFCVSLSHCHCGRACV